MPTVWRWRLSGSRAWLPRINVGVGNDDLSCAMVELRNLRADRRRVAQKIRHIRRSRPSPVTGCGCRLLGVVAEVAQDTVAPKISRVSVNHTNNASERAIGRRKVRYKSTEAMKNGIALTQGSTVGKMHTTSRRRWRCEPGRPLQRNQTSQTRPPLVEQLRQPASIDASSYL